MLETISEYIDLQLLLLIFIAFFSFVTLKFFYRKVSLPKIVQIFLTLVVICFNVFLFHAYLEKEEREYINSLKHYYIKGNVVFVSNAIDKMRIKYTDTNMIIQDSENEEILIKVSSSTRIYNRDGEKINLNSIKNGDIIYVKTTTGTLKNGENQITAVSRQKC